MAASLVGIVPRPFSRKSQAGHGEALPGSAHPTAASAAAVAGLDPARSHAPIGGPSGAVAIAGAGNTTTAVTPVPVPRHSISSRTNGASDAAPVTQPPPLDDNYVEAARRGEPSAWEAAYLAYGRALMGYLTLRLDNRDDAAEALSETFARAIDKGSSFRGDAYAFRAWLFSIARNVSADHFRRRSRLVVLADQPELDDRSQPSGDDRAIMAEDVAALRRGFGRLPVADQEVLWLRVCSGLSASDVGTVLGKKPGAVRMQQMRALEILRGQVPQ